MPRRRSDTLQFNAIQLVGGLLPASLIVRIARQKATDYGLQKNQRLQVAVDQAWSRAKALWQEAQQLRQRGDDGPWAPWFTRRRLEQVFGWSDQEPALGETCRDWEVTRLQVDPAADSRLGKAFRIGHSSVTPTQSLQERDSRAWFAEVVASELKPLLQEYWFDAPDEAERQAAALLEGW